MPTCWAGRRTARTWSCGTSQLCKQSFRTATLRRLYCRQLTAQTLHSYRPFNLPTPSRYFRFFERFESILRSELGARPHWTKGHFPSSEADLACMFGRDRIQRWREIRDEVDPDQMFWHGWLEERVGSTEGRAEVGAAEKREGRWEDVMGQK